MRHPSSPRWYTHPYEREMSPMNPAHDPAPPRPDIGAALELLTAEELGSSLPSRVADRLATAIISGDLQPGAKLSEPELARIFGISRTPIREALRLLERESLVTVVPRRGAQVSAIDPETVAEIYVCRAYLYGLAAKLATWSASDEDLHALGGIVDQMEPAVQQADAHAYFELNVRFHERVSELAENVVLLRMMEQLGRTTLRLRSLSVTLPGRLERSLVAHRQLAEAMVSRKPDEAEATVRRLVLEAGEAILRHHYSEPARADHLVEVLAGSGGQAATPARTDPV